jgi:hypothetical protein
MIVDLERNKRKASFDEPALAKPCVVIWINVDRFEPRATAANRARSTQNTRAGAKSSAVDGSG